MREKEVLALVALRADSFPLSFSFFYICSALILVLYTIVKDCLSLACNLEAIFGLPPYYSRK